MGGLPATHAVPSPPHAFASFINVIPPLRPGNQPPQAALELPTRARPTWGASWPEITDRPSRQAQYRQGELVLRLGLAPRHCPHPGLLAGAGSPSTAQRDDHTCVGGRVAVRQRQPQAEGLARAAPAALPARSGAQHLSRALRGPAAAASASAFDLPPGPCERLCQCSTPLGLPPPPSAPGPPQGLLARLARARNGRSGAPAQASPVASSPLACRPNAPAPQHSPPASPPPPCTWTPCP